mmetsp:Transcript_55296/g.177257  ORF Transcript_55296/g.177257 Transcript_55296/m.177257 type:complete len:230 (-) Transcript_55296:872-1561(-)
MQLKRLQMLACALDPGVSQQARNARSGVSCPLSRACASMPPMQEHCRQRFPLPCAEHKPPRSPAAPAPWPRTGKAGPARPSAASSGRPRPPGLGPRARRRGRRSGGAAGGRPPPLSAPAGAFRPPLLSQPPAFRWAMMWRQQRRPQPPPKPRQPSGGSGGAACGRLPTSYALARWHPTAARPPSWWLQQLPAGCAGASRCGCSQPPQAQGAPWLKNVSAAWNLRRPTSP